MTTAQLIGRAGIGDRHAPKSVIGMGRIMQLRACRHDFALPREVLPFAGDGTNFASLDLTSEGAGRVVAYVHGRPQWAGGSGKDTFLTIAAGFDEYVNSLSLCDYVIQDSVRLIEHALAEGDKYSLEVNCRFLDAAVPNWREQFPHLTKHL